MPSQQRYTFLLPFQTPQVCSKLHKDRVRFVHTSMVYLDTMHQITDVQVTYTMAMPRDEEERSGTAKKTRKV